MNIRFPLDGLTFGAVELDVYTDLPELSSDVSEEEKQSAWSIWIIENARLRATHKKLFDRQQNADIPDYNYTPSLIKKDGVYKQIMSPIAFEGDFDQGSGSLVLSSPATQDRHFRARGNRGNQKGNKHQGSRANRRDKKRIQLLNKK